MEQGGFLKYFLYKKKRILTRLEGVQRSLASKPSSLLTNLDRELRLEFKQI